MSIFTTTFAKAAFERAVKTFAQAGGAFLVAEGTGVLNTDWETALSVSGMAAILSLLFSVGSGTVSDGPSLANEKPLTEEERRILGKA